MEPTRTTLQASNIKCQGCATAARAAVTKVSGVREAAVNVLDQTVTVAHEPRASRQALAEALTRAGFPTE